MPAGVPFKPGHQLSLVHGGYSPDRVLPLAAQIVAELLAKPSCPPGLREDGPHVFTLELWSSAMAQCRLLRAALNEMDVVDGVTEVTEGEETEDRPTPVSMTRTLRTRRVQPLMDALHRHESRAMHLAARLRIDPASQAADAPAAIDLTAYWAKRDADRQREAEGGSGA